MQGRSLALLCARPRSAFAPKAQPPLRSCGAMLDAAPSKAGAAARGAHAAAAGGKHAADAHAPQSPPPELTDAELRSKIFRQARGPPALRAALRTLRNAAPKPHARCFLKAPPAARPPLAAAAAPSP